MRKQRRPIIFFTLLLIILFSSTFKIQPAKTEPTTITVPTDYPTIQEAINAANPEDTILVLAETYTENIIVSKALTLIGENNQATIIDGNGTGTVIQVTADNVTISGFSITNSAPAWPNSGILLNSVSGCNISNNIIKTNNYGILLNHTENSLITNNDLVDNWAGIELFYSFNITLTNNNATNNEFGIWVFRSTNNTLSNNNAAENEYGLWLFDSSNNILIDNHMTLNQYNFGIWGSNITHYIHEINASNLVNGKPIYYWINQHQTETPSDAGYIALVNSTQITVKDNTLTNNGAGILLTYTNNTSITNNTLLNNWAGIEIFNSFNITVTNNNASNGLNGIILSYSSNNVLLNNTATNNKYGIKLSNSHNNVIHSNAFKNNTFQVTNSESTSTWDNGYPSGGNYWSDYTGVDLKSGPNQNQPGSDGIGDTPYIIDSNNQDRYPLMNVTAIHDIAITNVTTSKTIIGKGFNLHIDIQAANKGNRLETANITVYANTTLIATQTLNITLGTIPLTFTWNTSNFDYGNYIISVHASPVPDETNTNDNTFIHNSAIILTILGDTDGDRDIDIYDIVRLASVYGAKRGEPRFNPNCDIDSNDEINIYDIVIATSRYGYKET